MTIGIKLNKYKAEALYNLSFVADEFMTIDLMMVLNDFTKRDLKDLVENMKDEEAWGDTLIDLVDELEKLLKLNEGRADKDLIKWTNSQNQMTIDEFIKVYDL